MAVKARWGTRRLLADCSVCGRQIRADYRWRWIHTDTGRPECAGT